MTDIRARIWASLVGGLFAGTLDIFVACTIFHTPPDVILHAIASGLIGHAAAIHGGAQTALLGLALQVFISVVAAGVYVFAAARLPILLQRPVICGLTFGLAVNLFMNFVVVPLSRAHGAPVMSLYFLENLIANMVLFGLPIALIARWFAGKEE